MLYIMCNFALWCVRVCALPAYTCEDVNTEHITLKRKFN